MKEKNMVTNAKRMKEDNFIKLCEETGVPPTKRQASKFTRGMGVVYRTQILHHKDVPIPVKKEKRY